MADLSVRIGSMRLKNPLIAASGCFGYGVEYAGAVDLASLGGQVGSAAVQHQRERRCELGEQALEVAPREDGEAGLVLRREERELLALAFARAGGEAEVIEERGDVGVAFVELVPERRDLGLVEPARRERGLAAARRAGDPGDGMVLLQQLEEAPARQHAGHARPSRLAQRYFARPRHSPLTVPSRLGSAPPRQPPVTRCTPCSPLASGILSTWCPRASSCGASAS